MKKLRFILPVFLFFLLPYSLFSQDMATYKKYIKYGGELYQQKNYTNAAKAYRMAFNAVNNTGTVEHRYMAAQACAQAEQIADAFEHLNRIARSGKFTDIEKLKTDPAFYTLHYEKGWEELCTLVASSKEKTESKLIQPLVSELEVIYADSRKYREEIKFIGDEYGWDSEEVFETYDLILEQDSINAVKVAKVLDTHGWLGADKIGTTGTAAIYLAILNADIRTQEKYLPMMQEAVKKGYVRGSRLAIMEDKVNLAKGKKQSYGTQVLLDETTGRHIISPLLDPDNVDTRRAKMGLVPLADYLKKWDIEWDPSNYKNSRSVLDKRAEEIMLERRRKEYRKWIWQE